jgi:hypothetical protein
MRRGPHLTPMFLVCDIDYVDDDIFLARLAVHHMEGVVAHNRYLLARAGGKVPPLLQSGVRARQEPWAGQLTINGKKVPGIEEFCHLGKVLGRGFGDCAQLCCWRVAELREQGINATFRVYCRPTNTATGERARLYHVQTRFPPAPRFVDDPKAGPIEDTYRLLHR